LWNNPSSYRETFSRFMHVYLQSNLACTVSSSLRNYNKTRQVQVCISHQSTDWPKLRLGGRRAHWILRWRGSHIFQITGSQMAKLSALRAGRNPRKSPGSYICYRLSRPQGHSEAGWIRSTEKSNDLSGNRTLIFSLQHSAWTTTLPRAPGRQLPYSS
jgi:hypothetical protein